MWQAEKALTIMSQSVGGQGRFCQKEGYGLRIEKKLKKKASSHVNV